MDENEELKGKITQLESENATFKADIEKLTKSVTEKDNKISELQTYICKNLTTPREPKKDNIDVSSFADLYKETLSQMAKKE